MLNVTAKISGMISQLTSKHDKTEITIAEDCVILSSTGYGNDAIIVVGLADIKVWNIKTNDCTLGNLERLVKLAKKKVIEVKLRESGRYTD